MGEGCAAGVGCGESFGIYMSAYNAQNPRCNMTFHLHKSVSSWLLILFSFQSQISCCAVSPCSLCAFCVPSNILHMVCVGMDVIACSLRCLFFCKHCGLTQISNMHDVTLTHVTAGPPPHAQMCAFSHA